MKNHLDPNKLHYWRILHSDTQSKPHPLEGTRLRPMRVACEGALVARFFLPLELAKPRNQTRNLKARSPWMGKAHRDAVFKAMQSQPYLIGGGLLDFPLIGRPIVCCFRYSSVEPDVTSGWSKVPVDCLQPGGSRKRTKDGKQIITTFDGLGIIASDSPKRCEIVEMWEKAAAGYGFCVFEVWTK